MPSRCGASEAAAAPSSWASASPQGGAVARPAAAAAHRTSSSSSFREGMASGWVEWRYGGAPGSPPVASHDNGGGGAEGMASDRIGLLDACMSRLASDFAKALRWRTTVPVRRAECTKRVARLMEDHGVSRDPASYPGGVAGVSCHGSRMEVSSTSMATQIHHIDKDNARHGELCAEFLHSCATTSSVARAHGRHVRGLEATIQGAELATFEALQSELRLVFGRYEHTFGKVITDPELKGGAFL